MPDAWVNLPKEIIQQRWIRFYKNESVGKYLRRQKGQAMIIKDEIAVIAKIITADVRGDGVEVPSSRVDESAFELPQKITHYRLLAVSLEEASFIVTQRTF